MLITRDDIQRIGDEETLLHFLEEKLNLPIPGDLPLEGITAKFSNFALGLSGAVANQVLDCQELSVSPGEPSGIILIRFNSESGYAETLRAVATGLDKQGRNPADLRFVCMNEYFQPFAFAYFSDSISGNWDKAVLTIFAWVQSHTRINTGSEHDLSAILFSEKSSVYTDNTSESKNVDPDHKGKLNLSENLLIKLQNIGAPLGRDEDIYRGISLGHKKAFVIDQATYEQLLAKDPKGADIIESFPDKPEKWKWESKKVICIPSSKNRRWPWSGTTNELEAERILKKNYPAISTHMQDYKNRLQKAKIQVEFYWEFPPRHIYEKLKQPKIIFRANDTSMQAAYDPFCEFLYAATLFIPTEDLSLLAILNSKLFDQYAHSECRLPKYKPLFFTKKNMVKAPIAPRTEGQKAELSGLVQQILDNPDSPKVPDIEREIDQLVYKLYELTDAEKALIEEETNP